MSTGHHRHKRLRKTARHRRFGIGHWLLGVAYGLVGSGCDQAADSIPRYLVLDDVVQVASGILHSCALRVDGTVACWGSNQFGQLGEATSKSSFEVLDPVGLTIEATVDYRTYAQVVKGLTEVTSLAAGSYHTCALLKDDTVRCWGDSSAGQLGNGDFSRDGCDGRPCSREPVIVDGLKNARSLALGSNLSCAVRDDGRLSCWGSAAVGVDPKTLAHCDESPCATQPVFVSTKGEVSQVAVGGAHACLIRESGSVACWGSNLYGQIGTDNPTYATTGNTPVLLDVNQPAEVTLPGRAVALLIAPSATFSCAQLEDRSLYCWGRNDFGQLGTGSAADQVCATGANSAAECAIAPQKVAFDGDVTQYVVSIQHGCALTAEGSAYCWGFGDQGQLGVDRKALQICDAGYLCARVPAESLTSSPVVEIALGPKFTCYLQEDQDIRCYGWGYGGATVVTINSNVVDCTAVGAPCTVIPSWRGEVRRLVLTHLDRMCALTSLGEIHCLKAFSPRWGSIEAEPIQIAQ